MQWDDLKSLTPLSPSFKEGVSEVGSVGRANRDLDGRGLPSCTATAVMASPPHIHCCSLTITCGSGMLDWCLMTLGPEAAVRWILLRC